MRLQRAATFLAAFVLLASCGSEPEPVMPDVVGKRLDVALSDIERAGIEDDPEILGGGLFGVVDETNWQVCEQSPADGQAAPAPRLTVERECESDAVDEPAEPSAEPSDEPSAEATAEPSEAASAEPDEPSTLTVRNSEDFADLVTSSESYAKSARFAREHAGEDIEFDANIAAFSNHGDYETRFDILIGYGDFSETEFSGPSFQFRDVGILDLNLVGKKIPNRIGLRDNLHVVATVGEFEKRTGLFLLEPVSTEVR